MSLDVIPADARVLIDANIFIDARQGMSVQCHRLLERCARREIMGFVTIVILAEFCHRRMMQEAQSRGLAGSNPAKALAQSPNLVRQLTQYRDEIEDLLSGELFVLTVESSDFAQASELQHTYGLLTNDSLNLAAGLRGGVNMLATADPQFDSVAGVTIFKPDDLKS